MSARAPTVRRMADYIKREAISQRQRRGDRALDELAGDGIPPNLTADRLGEVILPADTLVPQWDIGIDEVFDLEVGALYMGYWTYEHRSEVAGQVCDVSPDLEVDGVVARPVVSNAQTNNGVAYRRWELVLGSLRQDGFSTGTVLWEAMAAQVHVRIGPRHRVVNSNSKAGRIRNQRVRLVQVSAAL